MPSDFKPSIAARASGRTGSSSSITPTSRPSIATPTALFPELPSNRSRFEIAFPGEQGAASEQYPLNVHSPARSTARDHVNLARFRNGDPPLSSPEHDGPRKRMIDGRLNRGRTAQDVLLRHLCRGIHPDGAHGGPPSRDRSRLVEGGQADAIQGLEHRSAAKQRSPPGRSGDRDRGGHRGCNSESAGTRDDEHGQGGEAASRPIAAGHPPRERAPEGDQRHARNESRHEAVGCNLHRSAAAARLPGPAIHAAHEGLRFARRFEHQRTVDGDRSRKDDVARADQPGRRLARERRLGDVGGALDHSAVDRDFLSRTHTHALAAADLVRGNFSIARLLEHVGPRTRGFDGGGEGRRRSLPGAGVQILPEHDEDQHHRAGVVVELSSPAHGLHGRRGDRGEGAQGDERFEDDVTPARRPICGPEHGNAEEEVNSRSQSQHEPGCGPQHVDPESVERSEVEQALEHHDVAREHRSQSEPGEKPTGPARVPRRPNQSKDREAPVAAEGKLLPLRSLEIGMNRQREPAVRTGPHRSGLHGAYYAIRR